MKRLAGLAFFLIGLASLSFWAHLTWIRIKPPLSSPAAKSLSVPTGPTPLPVRVTITRLGVDLPVIPAGIQKDAWETTPDGVSYWIESPIPGQQGNSVLYGHNWLNLLAKLPQSQIGDEVIVTYANNEQKKFTIESAAIVEPTQLSIVYPTTDTRLTLYTCIGLFDSQRFVVVAKPLAKSKGI